MFRARIRIRKRNRIRIRKRIRKRKRNGSAVPSSKNPFQPETPMVRPLFLISFAELFLSLQLQHWVILMVGRSGSNEGPGQQNEPWSFDKQVLILKEVQGDEQPSNISFFYVPLLVRAYDPLLNGRNSGNKIGAFLEMDNSDVMRERWNAKNEEEGELADEISGVLVGPLLSTITAVEFSTSFAIRTDTKEEEERIIGSGNAKEKSKDSRPRA
ncbi:hypothetical protein Lal_00042250, partial [Lupinus albus]